MGQTLDNGIYLPSEGERNCYNGLAANWTTLDSVVGGYRAHVENENIHITSEERSKWDTGVTQAYVLRYASVSLTALGTVAFSALDNTDNVKIGDKVLDSEGKLFALTAVDTDNSSATLSALLIDLSKDSDLSNYYTKNETDTRLNDKADSSALTAHTGDTTIHVTAADKEAWNGKQDALSQTQLDAVNSGIDSSKVQQIATNTSDISSLQSGKANDSDVVHKSGNETVGDSKTFSSDLNISNTDTTVNTPNLNLRNYKADRATTETGVQTISFLDKNAKALSLIESRRYSNGNTATNILCYNTDNSNNTVSGGVTIIKNKTDTNFAPNADNAVTCGRALAKWSDVQTYKVNGLTPSSLSMPSGNVSDVIDISGYLTILDGSNVNTYVAPANGWISILMNNCSSVQGYITGLWGHQIFRPSVGSVRFLMPVLKNLTVNILIVGGTIGNARFIPCQGNM